MSGDSTVPSGTSITLAERLLRAGTPAQVADVLMGEMAVHSTPRACLLWSSRWPEAINGLPVDWRHNPLSAAAIGGVEAGRTGVGERPNVHVLCDEDACVAVLHATDSASAALPAAGARMAEVLAIQRLRDTVGQLAQSDKLQRALFAIADMAGSDLDMPDLLRSLHRIVGTLMYAENLYIVLHDAGCDTLRFLYFVDLEDKDPYDPNVEIPLASVERSLTWYLLRDGKPIMGNVAQLQAQVSGPLTVLGPPPKDWLGVPILRDGRTVGAVVVQSYQEGTGFSNDDRVLLEFVAGHILAALERKQTAQALRASETRYRLLFEQNQAGVYRTLPDGRILDCNEAFARWLGYASRAEIMQVNARSFYFTDTRGSNRDRFVTGLGNRGPMSNSVICLRRKDGREVWGIESAALIPGDNGEPAAIQGTVIDFTDRKRAEEDLHRSEARLEAAQRLAHLGSWTWDVVSKTLTWSDELCRIYGVDPAAHFASVEDFLGRVHPDDRDVVQSLVSQALADKESFSHEVRIIRPDGEMRTLFDQGKALVDEFGHATAMAGACLDITDRKLEERFEQDRGSILEQVALSRPLPDILARIVTMLQAQMPHTSCSVLLLQDGLLKTGADSNMSAEYSQAMDGLPIGPNVGSCGTACFTGKTVISEDIATDPLWEGYRELALPYGLRSCWSMPVPSSAGGVLGSLAVYCNEPSRPTTRDMDFMGTATQLVAVAIEQRLLTERLEHQAQHDALTGLPNRMLFNDRLRQALAQAERRQQKVAVLYLDLDRFKNINDTLGHAAGDQVLQQAAGRLGDSLRKCDTLARLGGDEFIVLVTELDDPQDAMRVARTLADALRIPFQIEGNEMFVSVSVGISVYPNDGLDGEQLVAHADAAMYCAKERGRNNFQWFAAEMDSLAKERVELEGHLRRALDQGQLSLHYQPLCGPQGEIQGFEALMRWHHPTLGIISPARFIPLAEDSGLIVRMGEWALRKACAQLVSWRRQHPSLRIAVNVSAVQLKRSDWVDTVVAALDDTGLDPGALELEITESLILQSVTETSTNLFDLRALGVGIAIDDFGTGYSSLSYLHKLPVTTLKIDQSFVREISAPNQEEAAVIRTIIALARNFGLGIVAEGVETEAQHELLVRLGCESLQGYFLHRPLTVEQASSLLLSTAVEMNP